MTWDADRVRIELCQVMSFTAGPDAQMKPQSGAEIWLSDGDGKIVRTRKPTVTITADTRPEVLRVLAAWIEQNGDGDLSQLAGQITGAKQARSGDAT
jgi:hypothetical protein